MPAIKTVELPYSRIAVLAEVPCKSTICVLARFLLGVTKRCPLGTKFKAIHTHTRRPMKTFRIVLAAAATGACLAAQASPALITLNGGSPATSGSDQLYGWRFTANQAVSVTALGVLDRGQDGLAVAHDVGIFRVSDQSLVASTTVGAGLSGFLDGDFRYSALGSAVALAADTYVIVMTMPQQNGDSQIINGNLPTTAAEISYIGSEFGGGSVLAFPTVPGAFAQGMFGPNFEFDVRSIPEPMSIALVGLGLVGLGLGRRRQ